MQAAGRALRVVLPGAAALLVQWLLHQFDAGLPFAPSALGDWAIRRAPGDVATEAIERFGENAKTLLVFTLSAVLLLAAAVGARRRAWPAVVMAGATVAGALLSPIPYSGSLTALSAAATGAVALLGAEAIRPAALAPGHTSRRRLLAGAGVAVMFGVSGSLATLARMRDGSMGSRVAAATDVSPAEADFEAIPGLSPRITSAEDHYVVDISLDDPRIEADAWRLHVGGDVAEPRSFTFAEIQAMPAEDVPTLLHCISNPVGGRLISNGSWAGFPLSHILRIVNPDANATLVRIEAADDYDETVDIADADLVRIAYGLGGRTLSTDHGYPVRLLYPGRYGMRSVKWLTKLTLISEPHSGYWERRGWDDYAVMKTGARIDTPAPGDIPAGPAVIAGVAWAGLRDVARVEVSADDGATWREARLEPPANGLSWVRWQLHVDLRPGKHTLTVRAVDGTGSPQVAEARFPHPSGASGYHSVAVTVKKR